MSKAGEVYKSKNTTGFREVHTFVQIIGAHHACLKSWRYAINFLKPSGWGIMVKRSPVKFMSFVF